MTRPLRILFVTSELSPLVSTGGLAEVASALPRALRGRGHDIRVALPFYRQISDEYRDRHPRRCAAALGNREVYGALHQSVMPRSDIPLYLVEHAAYFGREAMYGVGAYEYDDNAERFCFFCLALLNGLAGEGWKPDVVHCNDWHAAPLIIYLKTRYHQDPFWKDTACLFTIHNLAYQGRYAASHFEATGFDPGLFSSNYLEYEGDMNMMKGGIVFADKITTVSPRYAREIQTLEYGAGLHGVLTMRQNDLSGILNGVDYATWHPSTDNRIAARYDRTNLSGKALCKRALQDMFGLPPRDVPLFGVVSRLFREKGMDLLVEGLDTLMRSEMQLVILGTGHPDIEARIRTAVTAYPDRISAFLGFDADRAHAVYAGSDFFLMPSRFEPCGLGQLYAMTYGAIPLVRRTGGLADTVIPYHPSRNTRKTATGLSFVAQTTQALIRCIYSAQELYRDKPLLQQVQDNAMARDYSWDQSSAAYVALYESVVNRERADG